MPPGHFWDEIPATARAAIRGASRAREEDFTLRRDTALMTAYFAGALAQADWQKMPDFNQWLRQLTQPPRKLTNAEIVARFEAMASAGFDITQH